MLLSPNRADSEEKENACISLEELKVRTMEGRLKPKLKYHTARDKCNSPNPFKNIALIQLVWILLNALSQTILKHYFALAPIHNLECLCQSR